MNKIILITGPTSVGKTALSIAIAKKYDGGGHLFASRCSIDSFATAEKII